MSDIVYLDPNLPDDDPRWRAWQAQVRLGFLRGQASDDEVKNYRDEVRADRARYFGLLDPSTTLADTPVATLSSLDKPLNVGHGNHVSANLLIAATVRATHRRKGALRTLITHDLRAAQKRGAAVSLLRASEGGIYGRFGFGVATRLMCAKIRTDMLHLRESATGSVDYVDRETAGEVYEVLTEHELAHRRGAIGRMWFHRRLFTGELGKKSTGAPNLLRQHVVHRDETGQVDGIAAFEPVPDSDPSEIHVHEVLTKNPAAYLALWAFLATIDLVDVLSTRLLRVNDPLQWGILNPRALKDISVYDLMWLRPLDVVAMFTARGWDADGELILRVEDALDLVEATYAIRVTDGTADVTRTDATPQATVTSETLGSLYLGGIAPSALAEAGRIDGDAHAVVKLFTTLDEPWMPIGI